MALTERRLSAVPSTRPEAAPAVDARLARLEDEARRLRAEIAALQDDLRWLSGAEEHEVEAGWLARGWVRASLLLATVGVVAIVSLPYLLHSDPSDADRAPAAAVQEAPRAVRAVVKATAVPRSIAASVRVRGESLAVSRPVATDDRPGPPPRVAREPRAATTDAAVFPTPPSRDDSP